MITDPQVAESSIAEAPFAAPEVVEPKAAAKARPKILRQYELIEKVKSYDPTADEDLLNRAYVYAMRMHGSQTRASGPAHRTADPHRGYGPGGGTGGRGALAL